MARLTTQKSNVADLTNEVLEMSRYELSLDRAFYTFAEMQQSEPLINASLVYLKSLLNRNFSLVPHEDATAKEVKVTEAISKSFDNLDSYTKRELVSNILSFLTYGSSLFETRYTRQDGIYTFRNITPIRLQDVSKFKMKEGRLDSVKINNPQPDAEILTNLDDTQVTIERDKLLFFRLMSDTDNPLGTSLIKSAYVPYKSKSLISQYQLVKIAKDFGSTLQLTVPEEYLNAHLQGDMQNDQAQYMTYLLESMELLHSGQTSYVVLPSTVYEGGQQQFSLNTITSNQVGDYTADTTINRLNNEILLALSSSILALGDSGGGSYSLAEEKSSVVALIVKNIQETISDTLMSAIKVCFDLNGLSYDHLPSVKWEAIEDPDWETVGKFFNRLAMAGVITPDENLEEHLRKIAGVKDADYSKTLNTNATADPVERSEEDKQL